MHETIFCILESVKIIELCKGPQNIVKAVCSKKKLNHTLKYKPILILKRIQCAERNPRLLKEQTA